MPAKLSEQPTLQDDLFAFYAQVEPILPKETGTAWMARLRGDPALVKKVNEAIKAAPFKEQIRLLALRRAMAVAGATRNYTGHSGVNNSASVAKAYQDDMMRSATQQRLSGSKGSNVLQANESLNTPQNRLQFAQDMVDYLGKGFVYNTPESGSIFWSGIKRDKLAEQVKLWNATDEGEIFGQLEATTDARFIDGSGFGNDENAPIAVSTKYWDVASAEYANATGHITAVQVWALRDESVFCKTELPTMLRSMSDAIAKGKEPTIKDLSIVMIEDLGETQECKCFTNLEIGRINIARSRSGKSYFANRADCEIVKQINSIIPARVKGYWFNRGQQPASKAAAKIMAHYKTIKR